MTGLSAPPLKSIRSKGYNCVVFFGLAYCHSIIKHRCFTFFSIGCRGLALLDLNLADHTWSFFV